MSTLHVEMLNQICEFCDPHTRARIVITCGSMYYTLSNQTFLKQYAAHMRTVRDINAIKYEISTIDVAMSRRIQADTWCVCDARYLKCSNRVHFTTYPTHNDKYISISYSITSELYKTIIAVITCKNHETDIFDIHQELLDLIRSFLGIHDNARFCLVCRDIYELPNSNKFLKQYSAKMRTLRDISDISYETDSVANTSVRTHKNKCVNYEFMVPFHNRMSAQNELVVSTKRQSVSIMSCYNHIDNIHIVKVHNLIIRDYVA
jgi:hypothetical protein